MDLGELLAEWLPRQRWFGAKGRPLTAVAAVELARLPGTDRPLLVFVAEVSFADGPAERYQVPLSVSREPVQQLEHALVGEIEIDGLGTVQAYDAPHDKDAAACWLRLIADEDTVDGLAGRPEPAGPALVRTLPSRVIGAEQSNTSLVYGEDYVLKLFRRLAPGTNPDLEMTRALGRVGCEFVAAPVGWLEGPLDGQPTTLGLLQPYLRSATEGWALAVTSVRDLYAEGDLHADEVGGDFAGESTRLGVATANVHVLLSRALPARLAAPEESRQTAELMRQRLAAATAAVPELAEFAAAIRAVYDEVADWPVPVPVQRIHGDLHLGQALRTDTRWILLDFEGEPARPLDERTRLMSPLRDVAGMLRSFDYAARHLLAEQAAGRHLAYRAAEWAERNREAFCDGYAQESGQDPREQKTLLRAFELDKAVYEVVYEARNRPTWLPIPLSSIERLVS